MKAIELGVWGLAVLALAFLSIPSILTPHTAARWGGGWIAVAVVGFWVVLRSGREQQ